METILFFAVIFIIAMGWVWLKDKLWEGTTRAVFRGSHQKGQTATHTTEHFRAPVAGEEFMRALLNYLNLPMAAPTVMGGLHVGHVDYDNGLILFRVGNRISQDMEMAVMIETKEDGWSTHCTGEASVLSWGETNGLVNSTKDIERIFKGIEATCAHFQGEFTYTQNTD
ncbi:MAG TPA: hypothetical protein GXZ46_09105 [Actinomycetales bacterium]|nr:hypothetical protein [Actinomycetales bacterium]